MLNCFVFLCLMMDCLGLDFSFLGLKMFVVNIINVNLDENGKLDE